MRTRFGYLLFILSATVLSIGCASLHSVSLTQVPKDRKDKIEAKSSSWSVLGIYFSNGFVDEAIETLKSQCPDGKITGVYTKYDGRLYFIVTQRQITATAYCEKKSPSKV